jgi:transposase InsO family protein
MRRIDEFHLSYPFAGSHMLRDMLRQQGLEVGRRHVKTLMRRMAIKTIYRKPNPSKPAPGHRIYPHLLRGLAITHSNQFWSSDISYIPMAHGFAYLTAMIDWFSRRVLAWKLSVTMDTSFCIEALDEALSKHGKPEIFNTDQGSHFTRGWRSPSAGKGLSLGNRTQLYLLYFNFCSASDSTIRLRPPETQLMLGAFKVQVQQCLILTTKG